MVRSGQLLQDKIQIERREGSRVDIRDGSRSKHVTGSLKYVTLILNNRRTNDGDEHRKNIFFSFHRNAGWLQNMALIHVDGSKK